MKENQSNRHIPHQLNAPGPFYSENEGCMTCGAPHIVAPDLIGWYEDPGGSNPKSHCIFTKQPTTPDEVELAIKAMDSSCVENLRYAGTDPGILRRLQRLHYENLCDVFEEND